MPAAALAAEPEEEAAGNGGPAKRRRNRSRSRRGGEDAAQPAGFSPAALGLPEGREPVVAYITGSYRGVGAKTAETLADALGDDLFRTLQEDPDRVRTLLGDRRAGTLLQQWSADYERRSADGAPAAPTPAPAAEEEAPAAAEKPRAKSRGRRGGRGRPRKRTDPSGS
jgi:hypothetical protein